MTWLRKTYQIPKIWEFSENLRIFRKSENFPQIWKFSANLRIFRKFENFQQIWEFFENLRIFLKSENFPKIWEFSKNLKIFLKSENFQKIWNFSENLKIHKLQTLWNMNDFIDLPLACEDSWVRSQSESSNGHIFITYSFADTLEQQRHHWCTPGLWR